MANGPLQNKLFATKGRAFLRITSLFMGVWPTDAGIRPSPIADMKSSHTPLVKAYYDATYASLNLIPKIKCISTPDGKMYLLEIHLCASFDLKNFKNCSVGESSFNFDNCGSYQQISSMVTKAIYYHDPKKVVV
ncbi:Ribonuclease S-1 [Bienertia sinuspersici]